MALTAEPPLELCTPRMRLRRWRPDDREPFAALNADPRVMACFPSVLTRAESDALADRIEAHFTETGYGLWAVELPGVTSFAGFLGLSTPRFEAAFTPCTEIGWRLAADHWNRGYATEGATAVMSWRVMQKLGMTHDPAEDFDHPLLPADDRLSHHVLYRARRGIWRPV
jgi:RimJ/RimL family protein N-acetyltransferase